MPIEQVEAMTKDRIWYWFQLITRTSHAYGVAPPVREAFTPRPLDPLSAFDLLITCALNTEEENEALYRATHEDIMQWKLRVRNSGKVENNYLNLKVEINI
jgi:hypothetical protein